MSSPPEVIDEDFRAFWQRPPFVVALVALLIGGGLFVAQRLELFSWATEQVSGQVSDQLGGARYMSRQLSEELGARSPLHDFHSEALPRLGAALVRSQEPASDPRVRGLFEELQAELADEELRESLSALFSALLAGQEDLSEQEARWNQRLVELGEPFALRGALFEDHHDADYIPQTYWIRAAVTVRVEEIEREVQWRHRLDEFRLAAAPGFYFADSDLAWVRTDRAWSTLWNVLFRVFEEAEPDGRPGFPWREGLQRELREHLGDEDFEALTRGIEFRQTVAEVNDAVLARARRCGHRYRINRVPWMGFDTPTLDQMQQIARADRLENCPRLLADEADTLRRSSRQLQTDLAYQRAMPRVLAVFLLQKSYFAAGHAHAHVHGGLEGADGEIAGYLTGILSGPMPHLGLFKLCFDHRFGSREAYQGWARLLVAAGLQCRGEIATSLEDLFEPLAAEATARGLPILRAEVTSEAPATISIRLRD